jgi:UDP-N-acetylmuramoyl-L-alanyl-D-glutamate--2,6-diaminopimelate ligase
LEDVISGVFELNPAGLAYDSRRVRPGFVFFAIKGFKRDGHDYIPEAVDRGAVAVVVERDVAVPAGTRSLKVQNAREALALSAARFFGHPGRRLRVIGVTGTNGKTTTTHLISAVYQAHGTRVGLIGTLYTRIGDLVMEGERTTPESLDLQALLRRMVDEGITTVVMEVSSHALALHRVTGLEFDVAVFTNLTQDHLDFHADIEDYYKAKERLFTRLALGGAKNGPKFAVINRDDRYGERLIGSITSPVITYGVGAADVRARDIVLRGNGTDLVVEGSWGRKAVSLRLVGEFNVYNALAGFAVGVAEGFSIDRTALALENVEPVSGRFEHIDVGQDFTVVVDYAHTPDGLENVLRAARALTRARVIAVFGCGGDRDPVKRPVMGEIAGRLADFTVITSDNPRSEDPLVIINAVETGIKAAGQARYAVQPDRREAIRQALNLARTGDMVVIAGKGHENYQIIGDQKLPFDDREVAREVLRGMQPKR